MSDTGRKDFSTSMLFQRHSNKAKEELTPDFAKSTQQKVKETVTDTADRFARGAQPDESKSGVQETFDKAQRSYDNVVNGGASNTIGDKIKDTFGWNK
uniref:12 kDa heat shock protein n=1 Tax=Talaromyces marneffei PM1 TaxID=1077442 RepID=A0A093V2E5_TALMA